MAVAENGVASNAQHYETNDLEQSNANNINKSEKINHTSLKEQNFNLKNQSIKNHAIESVGNGEIADVEVVNGDGDDDEKEKGEVAEEKDVFSKSGEGIKKEIAELEEILTKLNPMAKEFVPPSISNFRLIGGVGNNGFVYGGNFFIQSNVGVNPIEYIGRRRRNGYGQGKRRMNSRTSMAQQEDVIRRTVYVSDIDQQVTEEQLAAIFISCGQVVDCRICGDPKSVLRFAFVEFTDEEAAKNALSLSGTMLGYYPVRVLPSKTAIAPVNPTFLPKSEDEREMCARTVYCANIDKKITQADVKLFFESFCGEVRRLRLLGDYHHSTRIAFVEFVMAESAIAALNCSGAVLGSLPIRVSPSKTPVRPRPPRSPLH